MKVLAVKNPVWANAEKTLIRCDVDFDDPSLEGFIPFVASPDDSEEHGREIFTRVTSKEFGKIGKFTPDVAELTRLASIRIKDETEDTIARIQSLKTLSEVIGLTETEADEQKALSLIHI